MSNETPLTVVGNLAEDPTLRFTTSGTAVCNFRVLSTPRRFNKQASEWEDGETLGINCSVWREAAENAAESLTKGARVVVTGRLVSRSWEDRETGQKRTVMEMQADEVGPSLRYATAKVTKTQQGGGFGGQQSPAPQPAAQQGNGWGGGGSGYDSPPF